MFSACPLLQLTPSLPPSLPCPQDLHRTGTTGFSSEEEHGVLKRVLLAYARYNKKTGYCQGFNILAAFILKVVEFDEAMALMVNSTTTFYGASTAVITAVPDLFKMSSCVNFTQILTLFVCSFGCAIALYLCTSIVCCCCCCCLPQILVYVVDHTLPENYFSHTLYALSGDMAVFRHLLKFYLPELALHMETLQKEASGTIRKSYSSENPPDRQSVHAYEPPLADVFSMQWFLTIFASVLPRKACRRVWDAIFLEGSEYVLYTAVAILAVMERYTLSRVGVCVSMFCFTFLSLTSPSLFLSFPFLCLSFLSLLSLPLSISPLPSPLHLSSPFTSQSLLSLPLSIAPLPLRDLLLTSTAADFYMAMSKLSEQLRKAHIMSSAEFLQVTPPSHPPSLPSSPPPSSLPWRTFLPLEAASLSTPLLL